jgi:hypothetical protein
MILWVAVSASLYTETPIAAYEAANDPARPLDSLSPALVNVELVKVAQRIKTVGMLWDHAAQEQHRQYDECSHPFPPRPPAYQLSLRAHTRMSLCCVPTLSPALPVRSRGGSESI